MILTVVHPQSGWTLFSIVPNWAEIWKLWFCTWDGDENQRILIKPLGTHGTRTNEKLNPHITLETISIQRWQGRHGWKSKDYSFSLYWNCACSNPNSEKEKKFLCYLYMSFIKRKNELGIFTTKSCSGCKEKYKRLRCTCRVVTLLTVFLSSCGGYHHRILRSLDTIQGHIGHIIGRWASSPLYQPYCWCFTVSVHKGRTFLLYRINVFSTKKFNNRTELHDH